MSDNDTFDPILLEEDEEVGTAPILPGDDPLEAADPDDVVVPNPTDEDEDVFPDDEDL